MNEPAINPYQAPSSQSLSAEVPKALGISQVELISYSTVALIQCVVATGLDIDECIRFTDALE